LERVRWQQKRTLMAKPRQKESPCHQADPSK
jgi:hypothetical protein